MSRWTSCVELTVTDEAPAPAEDVRAFYVDLHNMPLVHPLVVAVQSLSRSDTAAGYVQTYRVRDRISLGMLTFRIAYTVRMDVPRVDDVVGDVVAEVRQFPGIRLSTRVTFNRVEGGTRIVERMRIMAPRFLAAVTAREAAKAHTAMLAGIRRQFG